MATTYTAHLEGGPCDGTTRQINEATLKRGTLTCQGDVYKLDYSNFTLTGQIVFRDAGKAGQTSSVSSPGIHKAWTHLRHSANKTWPAALTDSRKLTAAALRRLAHARKVRI